MLDSIKDYLQRVATPDMAATLEDADKLLAKLEIRSHEISLEQEINLVDNDGHDVSLLVMYAIYYQSVRNVTNLHGLVIDTEDLSVITEIMSALVDIQNYEDVDSISNIIESEDDDLSKLYQLISLVTLKDPEEYAGVITKVDPNIFRLLADLIQPELGVIDEYFEHLSDEIRQRVKRFMGHHDFQSTFAYQLIQNNQRLGMNVDIYLDLIPPLLVGEINDNYRKAALELYSLVLISNVRDDNIINELGDICSAQFSSIDYITKVDAEVLSLIGVNRG